MKPPKIIPVKYKYIVLKSVYFLSLYPNAIIHIAILSTNLKIMFPILDNFINRIISEDSPTTDPKMSLLILVFLSYEVIVF